MPAAPTQPEGVRPGSWEARTGAPGKRVIPPSPFLVDVHGVCRMRGPFLDRENRRLL